MSATASVDSRRYIELPDAKVTTAYHSSAKLWPSSDRADILDDQALWDACTGAIVAHGGATHLIPVPITRPTTP